MAKTKATKLDIKNNKEKKKDQAKLVKKPSKEVKAERAAAPKIKEEKREIKGSEQILPEYFNGIDVDSAKEKTVEKREKAGLEKYYEAVGRRKEAIARVRLYTKKSTDVQTLENKALITVEGKPYYEYFRDPRLQYIVESPLRKLKSLNRFKATVKLYGGGIRGQADAIKLGLSRALVLFDPNFSKKLRKAGYLTRDARVKERRKYGLKKARKAPQWAKR
jgi:small subunit ribosomal protein S9